MEIHFFVMEKAWKIIVEKEWSPWIDDDDKKLIVVVL